MTTKLSHSGRFRKILLVLIVAVVGLGILVAKLERMVSGDGLWFAITTVTGVGYGDVVPITVAGRVVAVLLQVFGVVLFGAWRRSRSTWSTWLRSR